MNIRTLRLLSGLAIGVALGGCASTSEFADPRDPFETFNRSMYAFNETLDNALLKPAAEGYKSVAPEFVDRGVTNFFSNLEDVGSAVNNLLQFKLKRGASDIGRVLVNSTLGIAGLVDLASGMDLPKYGEDFGQTLGYWGMDSGPYLVLPLLGPSSGRDLIGLGGDWALDPLSYANSEAFRWSARTVDVVDTRADLLGASRMLAAAALDPYEFLKEAYLQKRRSDVYDGAPPLEEYDMEDYEAGE